MRIALILSLALVALGFTTTGAGYTVIDNEEPGGPTFAWDDIASTGTPIAYPNPDTSSVAIPMPFAFTFFGTSYTTVYATTKGYLTFTAPSAVSFANTAIPTPGNPDNMIAAFWDSLLVQPSTGAAPVGEGRWQVLGSAPNRRLVVLYKDFTHFNGTSRRFTFQVALYEGSNAIRIQYLSMSNGLGTSAASDYSTGISATIGIEDATGAMGLQYLNNGAPASNSTYSGLGIGFLPAGATAPWPTGAPSTLFSDSFDGAPAAWTFASPAAPIQWSVDATPATMTGGAAFSPPNSLNFNDGVDYAATGVTPAGSASSPAIALSGASNTVLRFRCNFDTETTGVADDRRWLEVSNDGFATTLLQAQLASAGASNIGLCLVEGVWHEHVVPLNPSWGSVSVRFRFEALDTLANTTPGWFVDDVRVEGVAAGAGPGGGAPPPRERDNANGNLLINDTLCGGAAGTAGSLAWAALALALAAAHIRTHMR